MELASKTSTDESGVVNAANNASLHRASMSTSMVEEPPRSAMDTTAATIASLINVVASVVSSNMIQSTAHSSSAPLLTHIQSGGTQHSIDSSASRIKAVNDQEKILDSALTLQILASASRIGAESQGNQSDRINGMNQDNQSSRIDALNNDNQPGLTFAQVVSQSVPATDASSNIATSDASHSVATSITQTPVATFTTQPPVAHSIAQPPVASFTAQPPVAHSSTQSPVTTAIATDVLPTVAPITVAPRRRFRVTPVSESALPPIPCNSELNCKKDLSQFILV